ncbi:MAG: MCP four helix bundle domain-containing protein [Desulfobacteraceae bacterium]|nr:MCP four helix bundle domain-containing protein [Desulfobacteraceae bacterium]
MKKPNQNRDRAYLLSGLIMVLALGLAAWAIMSKHENGSWLQTAFEHKMKKAGLLNTIRSNILMSVEEEKSSVMADTDEASTAFAEQSARSSATVEQARRDLLPLIEETKASAELESFQNFSACWERLQQLDREILSLAVQNTNLKALRLSFAPAGAALEKMESALNRLMEADASSPNSLEITRKSSMALINALKIRTLQAPHIAETSDLEMDRIEAVMKRYDGLVNGAFDALHGLVGDSDRPFLDAAAASYEDFRKINAQVIALSRQNSNVRSFAISLGQKRKLTAQCLDSLTVLEKVVQESMEFKATR